MRGTYTFSFVHVHTPPRRRAVPEAASPTFLGACPANASACRTMTLIWRMLKGRPLFSEKLSEWDPLAHFSMVIVGVSLAALFGSTECGSPDCFGSGCAST